jgi:SanA protein
MKRYFRFRFKRMACLLFLALAACGLVIGGSHAWVVSAAQDRSYDELSQIPEAPVALVLGCAPRLGNRPNLFYEYRMEAAAALFKAGKISALIVSGDNGTHLYDEPTAMKESLVAAGVPAGKIYCDYAGFRTLDSVVRAKEIFGQSRFIIVSQRFHNERAVFIAQRHGLDAIGYNAKDVSRTIALATHLREYLARVNAVLDVTLLQTEPKFYGEAVAISD